MNHTNNEGTKLILKPRSAKARHNLLDDIKTKKIGTLYIQEAISTLTNTDCFESIMVSSVTDLEGDTQHSLALTLPLGKLDSDFPLPVSATIIISDDGKTCSAIARLTGNALLGDQKVISSNLEQRLKELGIKAKLIQA